VTNTHIVENSIDVPSSGVGEPGVPPFAPALFLRRPANAFAGCRSAISWRD
jgi:CO/xanthine dehydrogenase Mo-binding subunit